MLGTFPKFHAALPRTSPDARSRGDQVDPRLSGSDVEQSQRRLGQGRHRDSVPAQPGPPVHQAVEVEGHGEDLGPFRSPPSRGTSSLLPPGPKSPQEGRPQGRHRPSQASARSTSPSPRSSELTSSGIVRFPASRSSGSIPATPRAASPEKDPGGRTLRGLWPLHLAPFQCPKGVYQRGGCVETPWLRDLLCRGGIGKSLVLGVAVPLTGESRFPQGRGRKELSVARAIWTGFLVSDRPSTPARSRSSARSGFRNGARPPRCRSWKTP